MVDLQKSREEIDRIDKEIVRLFEQRMEVAKDVAEYKIQVGKKVFDKEREADKLESLRNLAHNDFNRHGVHELFAQIMSMSRKLQYGLIHSKEETIRFLAQDTLPLNKDSKIVYFGVKGSYTEQAMEEYFGEDIESFNALTFKEVMEAVSEGKAHYGILPIENSSTGGITDIYDLLDEYDNYIVGQHILKIDQALLGLEGAAIEQLTKVYSHPQGLLQCSKFLDEYENIKRIEYPSTAASALKVVEDKDLTQGAIASVRAAQCYGLKVLKENINYNTANSTRFIVITNQKIFLKTANKISICFELPHESGSLYNMLSHFIYNNLNLTQIESRPIVGKSFEYRFFVDIEGNLNDPGVQNALLGVKEEATRLKILGNFLS
ncbi:chorismate mutase/prephenate dehydratase [Mobilisporobacter senegalensis]|uniref:Bifunctional chorismate mutase/prephenate dehydratase n=1 Tax=Mobilisporobacter senegalensis TaxID=1329262 RepID=A0A3N1XN75_9FIRM|nr:bifunctional chorismate mutase/prephenate dehydratase [Mobilisporobacter senegalensis]ROR28150.1 chorismate mutase/prephenate dehydratase [Mobilisporobacter senegalensis]